MTEDAPLSPPAPSVTETDRMNIVIVGHVDHGKSTIIGRLLADTGSLPEGKLEQVRDLCERTSKPFEYAFLLDALKDEQAQGITIDAARVFFKSPRRHYIIIDAPGHIEFLKNMITGAARAEAALLVIDAREGVRENSRRHGYMLAMLGIRRVAVLVNKMDLVGHSREVFENIRKEYEAFLAGIGLEADSFLPVSGMGGDNIASPSGTMTWHTGGTVLDVLDGFSSSPPDDKLPFRLPVQDVYKFTRFGDDRRIIAGTIASGQVRVGDRIGFYPSGKSTTVSGIESFPAPTSDEDRVRVASVGEPVGITLSEQLYVTRGDLAVLQGQRSPTVATRLKASVFWLSRSPLKVGQEVLLRIGTARVRAHLESISRVIDAASLEGVSNPVEIARHDVAECVLHCASPIAFDVDAGIPEMGRFVLIDNFEISGGGIIREGLPDEQSWVRSKVLQRNIKWEMSTISLQARAERYCQAGTLVLVTGQADSRKKDLAKALESHLFGLGRLTYYLGLGSVLYGVDADLKTPESDSRTEHRQEHLRRFAEVAHLFLDAGLILVSTATDLTQEDANLINAVLEDHRMLVIWSGDSPSTDVKPDLVADRETGLETAVERIRALLQDQGVLYRA
ncbi:MAG: adenylyl-sulfate kinase [Verrucomicrobiales bacterium]|nr:adenylyl-sulfate kinase [Planctomycetota bacterium]MCP5524686.1 adenylyl-sulfate kinase [Verrucomicrobiales bacterium]